MYGRLQCQAFIREAEEKHRQSTSSNNQQPNQQSFVDTPYNNERKRLHNTRDDKNNSLFNDRTKILKYQSDSSDGNGVTQYQGSNITSTQYLRMLYSEPKYHYVPQVSDTSKQQFEGLPIRQPTSQTQTLPLQRRFLLKTCVKLLKQEYGKQAETIGVGGMGAVFKLEGFSGMAYKVVQFNSRQDVLKETRVKDFTHEHIIEVYDCKTTQMEVEGHSENFLILEMKFYELGSVMKNQNHLTQRMLWSILNQIAQALKYLDGLGFIHRDVKPDNILVESFSSQNDEIKVVLGDFGLSRNVETISTNNAGTLDFMAPEAKKGHPNILSDVFSLGKTLEILTNQSFQHSLQLNNLIVRMTFDEPSKRPHLDELLHTSYNALQQNKTNSFLYY